MNRIKLNSKVFIRKDKVHKKILTISQAHMNITGNVSLPIKTF